MSRLKPFIRALLPGAALVAVAAGCTGTADTPAATGTTPTAVAPASATAGASATAVTRPAGDYQQQALAWGRRFAQCAREHGMANFPDPTFVSAGLDFPGLAKDDMARAQEVCQSVFQQAPPPPPDNRPPSRQEMAEKRAYSKCMREHGVSDFPDPKADGTFPLLGTRLEVFRAGNGADIPPDLKRPYDACWDEQGDWRMGSDLS
jgi:hypothetical protein